MGDILPTMTVLTSRGFYCFICRGDGTMPLHVMQCGHCIHSQCVHRVWHGFELFLAGQMYCPFCYDTFNIMTVYRRELTGSDNPQRPSSY